MIVCALETRSGPALAEVVGDRLRALDPDGLPLRPDARRAGEPGADLGRTADARLLAPVRPGKIVAIGLNYRDHAVEAGMPVPEAPIVFAKFPSSVVGPGEAIVVDRSVAGRVDWEVELAVVVGRRMRDVAVEDALSYVFGYTVANDLSARDVQFGDGQWVRGKSMDSFCPVGPWVVTADALGDVQDLRLRTFVNGEKLQDGTTAQMVFGVAELLAYCSRSFTLEAGDLLLTGTPWGCGEFMDPVRSLQAGDVVDVEVEGIGRLSNHVVERETAG